MTTQSDRMLIDSWTDGELASEISFAEYERERWCMMNAQTHMANYPGAAFLAAMQYAQEQRSKSCSESV